MNIKRHVLIFIYTSLLSLLTCFAHAGQLTGRVISVHDGDTLTVLDAANRQIKVRLAEIDTPETDQPYGSRAKQALSSLVFGKTVIVNVKTTDRYGRSVGRVYANTLDVNAEMVRIGAAWVYRQYATDQKLYTLENQAKADKAGLWGLPEAQRMAPWQWRHNQRTNNAASYAATALPESIKKDQRCGAKTTCKQMKNCQEAEFYLEKCGLSNLDYDDDGVPCESLCK